MKVYTTDKIRNVVLLGHGGCGKTTLTEAMASLSGIIARPGKVEDGTTISDCTKEETRRKISVATSLVPIEWTDFKINVLDTPGFFDFEGEVDEAMSVADGAIIVVSGKAGVEAGTERAWDLCEKFNLPRIFFITDMDIDTVSYREVVEDLSNRFGKKIAPFNMPLREGGELTGYVNVIQKTAFKYEGKNAVEGDVPDYSMEYMGQYNDSLVPLINQSLDSTSQALLQASNLMSSMSDTLAGMGNVFGALEMTASASDNSLTNTKDVLDALSERLTTTIDKVTNAKEDEKVKILMDTLTGDPDRYAAYFSSPVNITSNAVYPVENYGSSVTPFYTALAIWVGALILTAVMKARPDKKKYPGSTSAQRFFGRFLTFLTLAELQTLVTVLGNLYLFKIQCLHPFYYWLACAIAAFTFTILIYSLVVAFHDVGKAIAVVLVVIQIAGSSGTYPIEVLPEFFRKVYIFFPFPYAINAMRETIGGMYGHDYAFYLMQLSVFILVALGIGLLVQKPLHELSHFMEKRMHDTEMM